MQYVWVCYILLLHVENKNEINKSSLYKKNIFQTHEEGKKDKKKYIWRS